jgi:hypothetical protein
MCLIDACEAIAAEAVKMELERVRPEVPCKVCKPGDPCYWHRPAPKPEPTP